MARASEKLVVSARLPLPAPAASSDTAGEPLPTRWVVFAVVSVALFMSSLDASIVATVLPTIDHDLHAQINWSVWTITMYALGRVVSMPIMGKIGEQFGPRRILLISIVVFTGSSFLCGISTSIYMLVGLRFVQALGGGAFVPSATGIVSDQFGKSRDRAIGMFTSILPIGGIVGPVFGGIFVQYWTWRGIFFINVPIGIVVYLCALRYIPERRERIASHIDVKGISIFCALMMSLILGITFLGNGNVSIIDPSFLVPELVAIGLLAMFIRHTLHDPAPFIARQFIRGRGFGVVNVMNVLFGAAALGFGALVPLYAQRRYGISVLDSGTLLTTRALGSIALAGATTFMLRKTGYRLPMMCGLFLMGVGLVVLAISPHGMSTYSWLVLATGLTGLGMGMMNPASNNAGLQLAPDHVGAVAGLRGMFRITGQIVGVSIATTVIARDAHQGIAQAHEFFFFAIILFCLIPLAYFVPDHHGSW